jgi:hypothetical protein
MEQKWFKCKILGEESAPFNTPKKILNSARAILNETKSIFKDEIKEFDNYLEWELFTDEHMIKKIEKYYPELKFHNL